MDLLLRSSIKTNRGASPSISAENFISGSSIRRMTKVSQPYCKGNQTIFTCKHLRKNFPLSLTELEELEACNPLVSNQLEYHQHL